jgi:hypothetical protein
MSNHRKQPIGDLTVLQASSRVPIIVAIRVDKLRRMSEISNGYPMLPLAVAPAGVTVAVNLYSLKWEWDTDLQRGFAVPARSQAYVDIYAWTSEASVQVLHRSGAPV